MSDAGVETFESWLKKEAESVFETKGKDLECVDIAWLRKSINTDLSKFKRKEGNRKTLLLAIDRKMNRLKELSAKDYAEMKKKVEETI